MGAGFQSVAAVLPPPAIPAVTLLALLADRGYRREEIGRLTREWIYRVVFHPRDGETGEIKIPKPPAGRPQAPGNAVRAALVRRGLAADEIDRVVAEKQEAASRQETEAVRAAQVHSRMNRGRR